MLVMMMVRMMQWKASLPDGREHLHNIYSQDGDLIKEEFLMSLLSFSAPD